MASQEDGKTEALWRFLDLMLVAYALSCDIDAEIASFVMLPVLVVAERLALSDKDEDAGKLDHLQLLIRHGNAAHQGPELLVSGDVADVKMNVTQADSRRVRCRELACRGHRRSHGHKEHRRDRSVHGRHCISNMSRTIAA